MAAVVVRLAAERNRCSLGESNGAPEVSNQFWPDERAALIASQAMDGRIPAVYAFPRFAHEGGLISYGIDLVEQLGKAVVYVDRILKVNLKTAKTLGLTVPPGRSTPSWGTPN